MTQHRFSIRSLLCFVAVVALNVAVGRSLFQEAFCFPDVAKLLIGVTLPAIVLQVLVCMVICGRSRPFWLGFLIFGTIAMGSFVWGMVYSGDFICINNGILGRLPGSPLSSIWMGYSEFAGERLRQLWIRGGAPPWPPVAVILVIQALIWSLPQLLIGAIGGTIFWGVARRLRDRPKADPSEPAIPSNRAACGKSQAVLAASPTSLSN